MSAGSTNIWMPLYIGDYLADTMDLTTEQHGAYLLLLMHLWRRATLPDDDATLARIAGMTKTRWRRQRPVLAGYFTIHEGVWTHSGTDRQRERITKVQEQNCERAHTAATTRWKKEHAPSNAQALLEETKSKSHTKSHTTTKAKLKTKARAKEKPSPYGAGTPDARHGVFRKMLSEHWQTTNSATPEMPWNGRDAKALNDLLQACPQLNETQFRRLLGNRARSAVAHGDRVYLWICNLTRFQEEMTVFNRPASAKTNYASRAEINRDSVINAVERAIAMVEKCNVRTGETGDEPATVFDRGMPGFDGSRPERRALAMAGSSHYRMAPWNFAYGQTGTDGSLSYGEATAGAGTTDCDGVSAGVPG